MSLPDLQRDNVAVLIIDIQERMMNAMPDKELVIKNADALVKVATTYGLPLYCTEQYPQGLGPTKASLLRDLQAFNAVIIEKTAFSAALPELMEIITASNRKQIIIAGVETHVCVFQTVRDFMAKGFDVYVPWDAVNSRDPGNMAVALEQFRQMGAHVTSTETILFELIRDAKDPHFKELQALIK
ncbi:MAG TPA: isochorismatase family protein [Clostridiaceae bacterium]|nr:isochorismatase family protein [Clostridiaceae bacterium]